MILKTFHYRNEISVMSKIISLFIKFLNRINKFIWKIIIFLSKFIKVDEINHLDDKPDDIKYRLFNTDEPAIIEPFVKIKHKDYKQLIKDNNIKPINRRNGKDIIVDVSPCCGAPKDYLYDNTGKQKQFECKVCSYIFSNNLNKDKDIVFKHPHCRNILDYRVSRKDFDVYFCRNDKCPFYLKNKSSLNVHDKNLYKEHPKKIKLRYVYRKFNINLPSLTKDYREFIQYWCQNRFPFKLYQIIGLTNIDETSKKYRSQKQIIERFNRTLKYYYRPKGGFTSLDNANSYIVLFATYNNFLRPNSTLDWKTPVQLDELNSISNMPNK